MSNELRFVLITSTAVIKPLAEAVDALDTELEGLKLSIVASEFDKCVRCWHHREDIGSHTEHPELCTRCIDNIDGQGESRLYA